MNIRFKFSSLQILTFLLAVSSICAYSSETVSEPSSAPTTQKKELAGESSGPKITTTIRHRPVVEYYVPGHRIRVRAEVKDKLGLKLVRCYFRTEQSEDFIFVKMESEEKNWYEGGTWYEGVIPAPLPTTPWIEYLFLTVNEENVVVRSQEFKAVVNESSEELPKWQIATAVGTLAVYSEMKDAPESVKGFEDDLRTDIVESSVRFGYAVEGIYAGTQAGAAGTAAAATGSTVTASTSVVSGTTLAIGGGVAGGVLVAGAAGGGGGGSSSGEDVGDLAGTISGSYSGALNGNFTLTISPNGNISGRASDGSISGSLSSGGNVRASASGSGSGFGGTATWSGTIERRNGRLSGNGTYQAPGFGSGSWSGSGQ